jgi:phage-related protein
MAEKTIKALEYMTKWQEDTYEEIDTAEDVKVFNTIGVIVGLMNADMMTLGATCEFIELLSIGEKEKRRVYNVYFDAVNFANAKH